MPRTEQVSPARLRVHHLIAPGPMAGAEHMVIEGVAALEAAGCVADVGVIHETRAPAHAENFAKHVVARGISGVNYFARQRLDAGLVRVLGRLEDSPPHIVHVHGYKALVHAVMCRGPWKLVATHHGRTSHDVLTRCYEQVERVAAMAVDAVCVVSESDRQRFDRGPVKPSKVKLIENFLRFPAEPVSNRQRSSRHLRLLSVGRLSPEKGLDTLFRALAARPEASWRLDVLGDGPEMERLLRLRSELGLSRRITFLGFQPDVRKALASSDVFVMPSHREGMPLAAIEARAAGMPVVASSVGGLLSLVTDGTDGRLVPPRNPSDLSDAIRDVDDNFDRYAAAASARATLIQSRYSSRRWAEETQALYQTLHAGSPPARSRP